MTEVTPSISYSPEGIFEARSFLDEEEGVDPRIREVVQTVGAEPGYETMVTAQEVYLRVAVPVLLSDSSTGELGNEDAGKFIQAAQLLGGLSVDGSKDDVISLEYVMPGGLTLFVHPHFQRWLNGPGLSEQAARACIDAMAGVFGAEVHADTMRNMHYDPTMRIGSGSDAIDDFTGFTVASGLDNFRVSETVLTPDSVMSRHGHVAWQNLRLSTLGNCACMGVDGSDREVYTGSEVAYPELYRWKSHNVDSAVQTASLLLGAASLAYSAWQYTGREDIFSSVHWSDDYE
jgi:hypothetical protein